MMSRLTMLLILIMCVSSSDNLPRAHYHALRPPAAGIVKDLSARKSSSAGEEDAEQYNLSDDKNPGAKDAEELKEDLELASFFAGELKLTEDGAVEEKKEEKPRQQMSEIDKKAAERRAARQTEEQKLQRLRGDRPTEAEKKEPLKSVGPEEPERGSTLEQYGDSASASPLGSESAIESYMRLAEEISQANEQKRNENVSKLNLLRQFYSDKSEREKITEDGPSLFELMNEIVLYLTENGIGDPNDISRFARAIVINKEKADVLKKLAKGIFKFLEYYIEDKEHQLFGVETVPFDDTPLIPTGIELPGGKAMTDVERMDLAISRATSMMEKLRHPRFIVRRTNSDQRIVEANKKGIIEKARALIAQTAAVAYNNVHVRDMQVTDIVRTRTGEGPYIYYIVEAVIGNDCKFMPLKEQTGITKKPTISRRSGYRVERLEIISPTMGISKAKKAETFRQIKALEALKSLHAAA